MHQDDIFLETGCYLALDLGGTNYRVLLVHLQGDRSPPKIDEWTCAIPHSKMTGTGNEVSVMPTVLFRYILAPLKTA